MFPLTRPNTMKRALFVVFFIVMLLSGALADTSAPGIEPEYYYTRVIYTGAGVPEQIGRASCRERV